MATEIMDKARKRKIGIYSLLPLLAFLVATIYHLVVFRKEIAHKDMEDHVALSTETYLHFTPLAVLYGIAALITLAVLLYFIVHLIKLRTMNSGSKIFWAFILTMLAPLSFPLFWYTTIRREPRRLEVYPTV